MAREIFDIVIAELDLVAVPIGVTGGDRLWRPEEALEERVVYVRERRTAVERQRDEL